jgi:hypothetical protein
MDLEHSANMVGVLHLKAMDCLLVGCKVCFQNHKMFDYNIFQVDDILQF